MKLIYIFIIALVGVGCTSTSDTGISEEEESKLNAQIMTEDFDELAIDLDGDGAIDVYGSTYYKIDSVRDKDIGGNSNFTLVGVLEAANGWEILTKDSEEELVMTFFSEDTLRETVCSKPDTAKEVWPVFDGEPYHEEDCGVSRKISYSSKYGVAFTALPERGGRGRLLATGPLASGHKQYVVFKKSDADKKRYACIDLNINPIINLVWEDKNSKKMGFDYYTESKMTIMDYDKPLSFYSE